MSDSKFEVGLHDILLGAYVVLAAPFAAYVVWQMLFAAGRVL